MGETPIPLYYKLYVDLKESLNSGKYQKGDKLPTEKELCQQYSISRLTVRRAMDELRREGFIERLKGKGTFVTGSKREEQLAILTGFTDEARKRGSETRSVVLENKLTRVPADAVELFDIPADAMVVLLKRVRFLEGEPYAIEEAYLNVGADIRFLNITQRDMEKESLYGILRKEFNINISYAEEEMELTRLKKEEARFLRQEQDDCAIMRKRFTYTKSDICIEYVISLYRADKSKFRIVRRI
ncbi:MULTISPECIES: GntR family transcriptional regulator [unclassified Mesotoga]|uniref:GntR family transcriptional regulator n=1 Tax=unclassified Mesotoga TaxID=1184398 RepID=UPI000DA6A0C5|nr:MULTISPECIES: GntR family transcriptional regulator [unclassified Mesotoga]PZC52073.1 GntR family transcriptional regulator [Mesotoga sp. TolDC]